MRFPWLAQAEAMLPVHTAGMGLNLSCFPDDAIHVSGFGGEAGSVTLFDMVPQVDTVLRRG
jgi:hypothetical protein